MNVVPHKASARSSQSGAGGGTEWPPSWSTMPHGISVGRYVDPDFQKLEYAKLWSKVWQIAIRVDEIPEVNDYTVYTIGDQSVLLAGTNLCSSVRNFAVANCVTTTSR
jgi:hypothetical protein